MGWTYTNRAPGQSVADFFKESCNLETETSKREIIDIAVTLREAFAAYRVTDKTTGHSYVTALVFLIHHAPNAKDGYTFGYKDMEESMGPYQFNCPERILKQLSPLDAIYPPGSSSHAWASNWRKGCQTLIDTRALARKVGDGAVVEFKNPFFFTDGHQAAKFKVVTMKAWRKKTTLFRSVLNDNLYTIKGWRTREFTVETP